MKNLIISKDNIWTKRLVQLMPVGSIYSSICSKELIDEICPDWIFFFHWSDIVSKDIYENYKCAVIHTGNLPEGRGGSPIQNQILDGICNTKVNIIEMADPVDSGAIYCSHPITLQGNIKDIWLSIADVASDLILKCIEADPIPKYQIGTPKTYKRIKDNSIKFDNTKSLSHIYDQIRMVDSEDYPNAYIEIGDYKIEFSRSKMNNNNIITDAKITKK
tara:strand:+ start:1094 stop:1747 length:654 start_codon:yes stop_codon:yes gene_type:complete